MKNKIWMFHVPLIALFTFAFYVDVMGMKGTLTSPFLREKIYPVLKTYSGFFTDQKFKIRGPIEPKSKIVIVEVDSPAIEAIGRWPWHRDATAYLIERTFQAGAKVVGLDMVFSEPDKRVPDELVDILKSQGLGELVKTFETDYHLERVIAAYRDKLVLGWATEMNCQPGLIGLEECPVDDPAVKEAYPETLSKFAIADVATSPAFTPETTPFMSVLTWIANIPLYNSAAQHSGYFNAFLDPDGYIRRTNLFMVGDGKFFPSLPLEMARIGLNEEIRLELGEEGFVKRLGFSKSGRDVSVSPLGVMEVNFRGPGHTFAYIPALEVMKDGDEIEATVNRKLATVSKAELLRDAYVLIGVSAIGVFDMRAFPFDSNVPGVEGHANILDNLLSGDNLLYGGGEAGTWIIFFLMIAGALLFGLATERLESVPALALFIAVMGGMGAIDQKLLFESNLNWNTGYLYAEIGVIFAFTMAIKYVLEERSKKFVRGAFTKYVSPAVVDSILKDPAKLTVGGEKRNLTIMFTDIRSFTTFSEKMDAKLLSSFLNDYLGIMTEIVFKHEGTLDKYIGDAIMAFWGAPLDQPKHALKACLAAQEMMRALQENRPRWLKDYGVDVQVGAGINSGPVSVGNMGSKNNFAYTVLGDHVNLASRLEGLTKYYSSSILTTRFTFDLIQKVNEKYPPHRVLDFVKVKGKKNAIELIQVFDEQVSEAGLTRFSEARKLYAEQKWDDAISAFRESSLLLLPNAPEVDGPCQMYIERCEELKARPPGEGWNGTWEMTSK